MSYYNVKCWKLRFIVYDTKDSYGDATRRVSSYIAVAGRVDASYRIHSHMRA